MLSLCYKNPSAIRYNGKKTPPFVIQERYKARCGKEKPWWRKQTCRWRCSSKLWHVLLKPLISMMFLIVSQSPPTSRGYFTSIFFSSPWCYFNSIDYAFWGFYLHFCSLWISGILHLQEFDKTYGGGWQCVVGSNFGCFFTHTQGTFIYFAVESLNFLIFKGASSWAYHLEHVMLLVSHGDARLVCIGSY